MKLHVFYAVCSIT